MRNNVKLQQARIRALAAAALELGLVNAQAQTNPAVAMRLPRVRDEYTQALAQALASVLKFDTVEA